MPANTALKVLVKFPRMKWCISLRTSNNYFRRRQVRHACFTVLESAVCIIPVLLSTNYAEGTRATKEKKGKQSVPGAKLQPLESLPCQSVLADALTTTETAVQEADIHFFKDHVYFTKDQEYTLNVQLQAHIQLLLQSALMTSQTRETSSLAGEVSELHQEISDLRKKHSSLLKHVARNTSALEYWKDAAQEYDGDESTDSEYEDNEDNEDDSVESSSSDDDEQTDDGEGVPISSGCSLINSAGGRPSLTPLEKLLQEGMSECDTVLSNPLIDIVAPAFLFAFKRARVSNVDSRFETSTKAICDQMLKSWTDRYQDYVMIPPPKETGSAQSSFGTLLSLDSAYYYLEDDHVLQEIDRVEQMQSNHNRDESQSTQSSIRKAPWNSSVGGCSAHLQMNRAQTSFEIMFRLPAFFGYEASRFFRRKSVHSDPWWSSPSDYTETIKDHQTSEITKHPGACVSGIFKSSYFVLLLFRHVLHPALWPALYTKEKSFKMGLSAKNPLTMVPAEERLFFIGLLRFGESYQDIHKHLMPARNPGNLRIRFKNRSSAATRQQKSSSILQEYRSVSARGLYDFDHWEAMTIAEAALRYTKQAKLAVNIPWCEISSQLLPHRGPELLRKYAVSFLFRVPRKVKWPISKDAIANRWKKSSSQADSNNDKFTDPFNDPQEADNPFAIPSHRFHLSKQCFPDLRLRQGPAAFVASHYFDRLRYPGSYDGLLTREKPDKISPENPFESGHGITTADELDLSPSGAPPSFSVNMTPGEFDASSYLRKRTNQMENGFATFAEDNSSFAMDGSWDDGMMGRPTYTNSALQQHPPQLLHLNDTNAAREVTRSRCPSAIRQRLTDAGVPKNLALVKELPRFPFTTSPLVTSAPNGNITGGRQWPVGGYFGENRHTIGAAQSERSGYEEAYEVDKLSNSSEDEESSPPRTREVLSPQEREVASVLVSSRKGLNTSSQDRNDGAEGLLAFQERSAQSSSCFQENCSPSRLPGEWDKDMDTILLTEFKNGDNNEKTWNSVTQKIKRQLGKEITQADVISRYQFIINSLKRTANSGGT